MPERLHYLLIRHVIDTGYAPDLERLASLAGLSKEETERGLSQLREMHGVILVPGSTKVWSLHPFALMPTQFWVESKRGGWWANCAWCSLGIGAALHEDITVRTSDGGEGCLLTFRIEACRADRADLLMHFPYPPARWWDNPYCPCGNILFFSSEERIERWCSRHGHPKGSVLSIATGIALAESWFGDYASPDWRRKGAEQATKIFSELRLDPSFWNIPQTFR
jgi:hypothetical protein